MFNFCTIHKMDWPGFYLNLNCLGLEGQWPLFETRIDMSITSGVCAANKWLPFNGSLNSILIHFLKRIPL